MLPHEFMARGRTEYLLTNGWMLWFYSILSMQIDQSYTDNKSFYQL